MLCPFCLTNIKSDVKSCSSCDHPLPPDYIEYHSGWLAHFRAPAIVSVIGFSGHGKTVYLASLYFALQNLIPGSWDTFFRQGLTMNTLRVIYENLRLLKKGKLPPSTPDVFPEPNIDRLHNVPKFGDRTVLMYDPPGDAFELHTDDTFAGHAGFVKESPCALFLISLTDMMQRYESQDFVADEMYSLLERYYRGMRDMGGKTEKQHLIVVYTKADRLLSQSRFPPEVIKSLENSDVDGLSDVSKYLMEMKKNSLLLKNFTRETMNAHNFLSHAREHFKSLEFCAVSALGSEPKDESLVERITPRRVLDPLLWVLKKSQLFS